MYKHSSSLLEESLDNASFYLLVSWQWRTTSCHYWRNNLKQKTAVAVRDFILTTAAVMKSWLSKNMTVQWECQCL